MDQATFSRQIRQLEEELGFRLLHRTTRSVELTDQGEELLPAACELARALDEAERRIGLVASQTDGILRFGMHPLA